MSLMRHWVCGLGHSFSRDPGATCPREDRLSHEPCGAPVFEWVDAATYQGAVDLARRLAEGSREAQDTGDTRALSTALAEWDDLDASLGGR